MNREYYDYPGVSNSLLGYLNISPAYFKAAKDKMLENKEEDFLELGTIVHEMILHNKEFDKNYAVLSGNKPSSQQQESFCREMASLLPENMKEYITEVYINNYSAKNKTIKKIEEEATKLFNEYSDYILFLKEADGRVIISGDQYTTALECVNSISSHKKASSLLLKNNNSKFIECRIEKPIYFTYNKLAFKALPDKVTINHKEMKVSLIDLKTTSGNISKFGTSFKKYDYDRQLAFYKFALLQENPELSHYEWEYLIPVVETKGLYEAAVYRVSEEIIGLGKLKYEFLLSKLEDCEKYGYNFPKEYFEGDGTIDLVLEEEEIQLGF